MCVGSCGTGRGYCLLLLIDSNFLATHFWSTKIKLIVLPSDYFCVESLYDSISFSSRGYRVRIVNMCRKVNN